MDRVNFLKNVLQARPVFDVKVNALDILGETLLTHAVQTDVRDKNFILYGSNFKCAYFLINNKLDLKLNIGAKNNTGKTARGIVEEKLKNEKNDEEKKLLEKLSDKLRDAYIYDHDYIYAEGGKRNATRRSNSKRKTKRHFKKAKSRKYRL